MNRTQDLKREIDLDPEAAESLMSSIDCYPMSLRTIALMVEELREVCCYYSPTGAIDWIKRRKAGDMRLQCAREITKSPR